MADNNNNNADATASYNQGISKDQLVFEDGFLERLLPARQSCQKSSLIGGHIVRAPLHSLTTAKKEDWKTGSKKMHERICIDLKTKLASKVSYWHTQEKFVDALIEDY